jgi:hypothetical protein
LQIGKYNGESELNYGSQIRIYLKRKSSVANTSLNVVSVAEDDGESAILIPPINGELEEIIIPYGTFGSYEWRYFANIILDNAPVPGLFPENLLGPINLECDRFRSKRSTKRELKCLAIARFISFMAENDKLFSQVTFSEGEICITSPPTEGIRPTVKEKDELLSRTSDWKYAQHRMRKRVLNEVKDYPFWTDIETYLKNSIVIEDDYNPI